MLTSISFAMSARPDSLPNSGDFPDEVMFCDLIREARYKLGYSQKAVAFKLGVNYNTINRWEMNKKVPHRASGHLEHIADTYGLPLSAVRLSVSYSRKPRLQTGGDKSYKPAITSGDPCSEDGCSSPAFCRGLCRTCYMEHRISGRLTPVMSASGYYGVNRNKSARNCWSARVRVNRKEFHIGSFPTAEAAARAYDAKVIELGLHNRTGKGPKPKLNFPDEHMAPHSVYPSRASAARAFLSARQQIS